MTEVKVNLIVDNFCLVCSGNGRSVDKVWNQNTWNLPVNSVTLTSLSHFSFVYLIAWSDVRDDEIWKKPNTSGQAGNSQGLLAEVNFSPQTSSGNDSWRVLPTGNAPEKGMSPSLAKINEVMMTKPWGDWKKPFNSRVSGAALPVPISQTVVPPGTTIPTGSWIWNNEFIGKQKYAPFWPGYDHKEFLIFRVPPPTPTKPIDLELSFGFELPKREGDSLDSSLVDAKPSLRKLDNLAAYIAAARPSRVTIEGHTSSEGNDNVALSERRAKCVAAWLAEKSKLPADSFEPKGMSSKKPNCQPPTNPKNRRVEFIFSW